MDIQSHQSHLLYMVVNGQIFAKEHPIDLFVELFRITSETYGTDQQVKDIWLSRTPPNISIGILEHIFHGSEKPTLHVETWRTEKVEPSYPSVLQGMGCISSLKNKQYSVKAWNWEEFAEETGTSSCSHYNEESNIAYAKEADHFQRSLQHVSGLEDFCS